MKQRPNRNHGLKCRCLSPAVQQLEKAVRVKLEGKTTESFLGACTEGKHSVVVVVVVVHELKASKASSSFLSTIHYPSCARQQVSCIHRIRRPKRLKQQHAARSRLNLCTVLIAVTSSRRKEDIAVPFDWTFSHRYPYRGWKYLSQRAHHMVFPLLGNSISVPPLER